MTDFYDPNRAALVTRDAQRILGQLIGEMRTKANNNEAIKPSTLEMFADDLDSIYNKISVDILPLL